MRKLFSLFVYFFIPCSVFSQSTVTLRRTFIDSIKNRITIDADFDVWYCHKKANMPANDGDIHASGYDKKIGMPSVAEVMNAADEEAAMNILKNHAGNGVQNNPKISITGVWRLWPEHPGEQGAVFFQGMKLSQAEIESKTTNPDHVFEVHPITRVNDIDVRSSFKEIKGYTPWPAEHVFEQLSKKMFVIASDAKTISFTTKKVGFNYINAWIRLDNIKKVKDGAFSFCTILDSEFEPNGNIHEHKVAENIRVGFAKGTVVYSEAIQKGKGGIIHILGTTRINLSIVASRVLASNDDPKVLNDPMPMEIIALGLIENRVETER